MTKNHHIKLNLRVNLRTEPPGLGSRQQGLEAVEHFILLLLLLLLEMFFKKKRNSIHTKYSTHYYVYMRNNFHTFCSGTNTRMK